MTLNSARDQNSCDFVEHFQPHLFQMNIVSAERALDIIFHITKHTLFALQPFIILLHLIKHEMTAYGYHRIMTGRKNIVFFNRNIYFLLTNFTNEYAIRYSSSSMT